MEFSCDELGGSYAAWGVKNAGNYRNVDWGFREEDLNRMSFSGYNTVNYVGNGSLIGINDFVSVGEITGNYSLPEDPFCMNVRSTLNTISDWFHEHQMDLVSEPSHDEPLAMLQQLIAGDGLGEEAVTVLEDPICMKARSTLNALSDSSCSKIGGEGLRKNGDVVNEDRISELHDDLLLHILSSLPTATAIATSVLSKRWKSLWKMSPNLKFIPSNDHHPFSESNVSRTLILHKAPVLESLHLEVGDTCDASEIELWIGLALARHVRKLVLDIDREEEEGPIKFPDALCRFNNTLEILKLEGSILLNLHSPVCFKSLRELHLCYVEFEDEESVSNLLCCCPCLEDLVVIRECQADSLLTFTVAVPSLQRLTIEEVYNGGGEGGYVINCPSLKYLNLKRLNGLETVLIENAPELVEAKITQIRNIGNENIMLSLTSAKLLSLDLSPLEIKCSSGKVFYQLLSLELCANQKEWSNLLSIMLDTSPKLQNLKLVDVSIFHRDKSRIISRKWNQPKCVPKCLLSHLETFVWKGYGWKREDENEIATYILKNARCLKKVTLSTKRIDSKKHEKVEKRLQMLKQLASVVRASDSCHLVCQAGTYVLI